MNRFYVDRKNVSADTVVIDDRDQVHHIKDVIRLEPKEPAAVFDDGGTEYDCVVREVLADKVVLSVKKVIKRETKGKVYIAVACAIPKHSKIDDIIDKLTQLGVDRIIPLMTRRVIVRMDGEKQSLRRQRWAKIALAASKQSQRNSVPIVDEVTEIQDLISFSKEFDLKLIPTLSGELKSLKDIIRMSRACRILALIGPEGDFTADEVGAALKAGFIPVSLGNSVLRVETAAVYIAGILHYEFPEN